MERSRKSELSYGNFCKSILVNEPSKRLPLWGNMELTARCNLRCRPCYINTPPQSREALAKELTTTEVFRILDQLADAGCLCLLLTGGEPLLRTDFPDLYLYAKRKGLFLSLFTNGTLITPEIADMFAQWPPKAIEITVYGSSEDVYEEVTRVRGSYARCMRGIELLRERDLPLGLKTIAITTNVHDLPKIKRFADDLGVNFRFDPVMNPRLDGDPAPLEFRISPEDSVALDRWDMNRIESMREFVKRFFGAPRAPENLYNCAAGLDNFHIDSCGAMSACLMIREPTYDLRQGSFSDGWNEFIPRVMARKRTKESLCQWCELHALCHQCPGWALMENGDQETRVEYLCRLTHLRADAIGLDYRRKEGAHDGA